MSNGENVMNLQIRQSSPWLLAAMLMCGAGLSDAVAACRTDTNELIEGKNRFSCPISLVPPLSTAGTVRGADECAKQGGQ